MSIADRACRACGHAGLKSILDLGRTPLANALLTAEQLGEAEPVFPLEMAFCPACALAQLTETVPPEQLFSEYLYFSSYSDALVSHARANVHRQIQNRQLNKTSQVVEIASNDGYLLQFYREAGIPALGIEPAANIAKAAEARGVRTLCAFFGEALADDLHRRGLRADVIHANNVLAHVPDLNGFVQGLARLLKAEGVAVIEFPYLKDLIDHVEFDTIYHEHLCYFALTPLDRLFQSHGLLIHDVERLAIHGGSLRIYASPSAGAERGDSARALLEEEAGWRVEDYAFYQGFAQRVAQLRESLRGLLAQLKQEGRRIAAYGAAAKGSTLLNYCGIGQETLDYVVDRNAQKQGRHMPGAHLPVHAPEKLLEDQPDFTLLLTWNFADEILKQQAEYRARGGRFLVPIPEVRVV